MESLSRNTIRSLTITIPLPPIINHNNTVAKLPIHLQTWQPRQTVIEVVQWISLIKWKVPFHTFCVTTEATFFLLLRNTWEFHEGLLEPFCQEIPPLNIVGGPGGIIISQFPFWNINLSHHKPLLPYLLRFLFLSQVGEEGMVQHNFRLVTYFLECGKNMRNFGGEPGFGIRRVFGLDIYW